MREAMTRLVAHLEWADDRTLHSLRRATAVPPRALTIYAHVLGAEHTWLSRLRQEQPVYAVWPELDVPGCDRLARANHDALRTYIGALDAAGFEVAVTYTNTRGETFESRIGDILLHVATHGAYHRGQVAQLLRMDDIEPIATDYIVYARTP